jgi:hypothetical protein
MNADHARAARRRQGRRQLRAMPAAALAATLALLVVAGPAAARTDLTRSLQLKRCPGTIHAGFTPEERRRAVHYGRYRKLSCRRARAIVRLIDHVDGPYPAGYFW